MRSTVTVGGFRSVLSLGHENDLLRRPSTGARLCLMDIVALQHELEALPSDQQDRVAAFLTALRLKRDGRLEEISRRLDDKDPANWIAWDQAKQRLGLNHRGSDR